MPFKDFLGYFSYCYRKSRGSIFIGGLVGGMFLSFLMDEDEKCYDRSFTNVFFVIGILHYVANTLSGAAAYAKKACEADQEVTLLERKCQLFIIFLQHLVKVAQYPMVIWLGWYVIKLNSKIAGVEWTHDRDYVQPKGASSGNCTRCFCDRNTVHLATLVFIFQLVYGIVSFGCMWFMWYVDSEDDAAEMEEDREWTRAVEAEAHTWKGKLKEVGQMLCMDPFFNGRVAGVVLSTSVALPHTSCAIHITEWFLVIGIVSCVTEVFMQLTKEVEVLAAKDGIINRAEHILIDCLKFFRFPFFLLEIVGYGAIVYKVIAEFPYIEHEDQDSEHFCQKGIWNICLVITFVYSLVFVFRITVIVASIVGKKETSPKDD